MRIRLCQGCGIDFADVDDQPCRGETKYPPWCNGDHNCYLCRLRMDLLMVAIFVKTGQDPHQIADSSVVTFFDSLPEDDPLRVMLLWEADQTDRRFNEALERARP